MEVYLDTEYKVHAEAGTDYTTIADALFDNKCPNLIESYRYVPAGATWTREDSVAFAGPMIAPWRDIRQYDGEQQQYLLDKLAALQSENAEYESALTDIEAALGVNA